MKTLPISSPADFFAAHAGYSYDPLRETARQGQARNARRLAAAEVKASRLGYSFHWELDGLDSSEWSDDTPATPTWRCAIIAPDGSTAGTLSGIDFGNSEPWGQPYRRVVEAELALENLD